jgi:putative flippase GtrA
MQQLFSLRLVRYFISGSTSTVVDLALLYVFTHWFGWWYLWSAIVAMLIAIFVSFSLQKFWTFNNHSLDTAHQQFFFYTIVALINLGVNTLLMYLMVDLLGVWYLLAQVIAAGLIAISSFFVYRHFIFKIPV